MSERLSTFKGWRCIIASTGTSCKKLVGRPSTFKPSDDPQCDNDNVCAYYNKSIRIWYVTGAWHLPWASPFPAARCLVLFGWIRSYCLGLGPVSRLNRKNTTQPLNNLLQLLQLLQPCEQATPTLMTSCPSWRKACTCSRDDWLNKYIRSKRTKPMNPREQSWKWWSKRCLQSTIW